MAEKGTYLNGMLSDSYILKRYKFQKQTLNFNCNLRKSFCVNSLRKISKVKIAYWGFPFFLVMIHIIILYVMVTFRGRRIYIDLAKRRGRRAVTGDMHSSKDTIL